MNFNVNFNVLLSKYVVHPLVKTEKTLIVSRCTVKLWKLLPQLSGYSVLQENCTVMSFTVYFLLLILVEWHIEKELTHIGATRSNVQLLLGRLMGKWPHYRWVMLKYIL